MIDELKEYGEVIVHANLKNYNTYRINGSVKYLIEPNSIDDLKRILRVLKEHNIRFFVLGNGSNIILKDEEYDGAFIKLNKLNGLEIRPEMEMAYAEAGVMLPVLATEAVNNGLTGLEFTSGIPGTVGGAVYGNAGAYNSSILDYVTSVTILDENNDIRIIDHEDITYSYRHSMFKEHKEYIILAAKFYLQRGSKENSLELMADRQRRRLSSQPLEYPSAGSVFRNPEGDFAGRLIEACELKGYKIGGAEVSTKHANFIINKDNAKGMDIYNLINYVHDVVKERTEVDLFIEQEYIDWK